MIRMQVSDPGIDAIAHHEGTVEKAYFDPANVLTIGCGFTWLSTSFRKWWLLNRRSEHFTIHSRMSRDEIHRALKYLLTNEYAVYVNRFFDAPPPQHVFDAAVSVVYNLGERALSWKWADAMKYGDYASAARLLESTGVTANGVVLGGLKKRREAEAKLLLSGMYPFGYDLSPADPMADGVLRQGERGAAVNEMLKSLKTLGFYSGKLDGIFGHGAKAAVLAFQDAKGLKEDGVAGPVTLAAIDKAVKAMRSSGHVSPPASGAQDNLAAKGIAGLIVAIIKDLFGGAK